MTLPSDYKINLINILKNRDYIDIIESSTLNIDVTYNIIIFIFNINYVFKIIVKRQIIYNLTI